MEVTPGQMDRRSFLRVLPGAVVLFGGCLGEEVSGGFSAGENESGGEESSDGRGDENEAVPLGLRQGFEERGLEVLEIAAEEDTIVVTIQTSGDVDEDIRQAASAYATAAERLDRDLRVRVEDRGLVEATFEIEREWATRFVDERLSDAEYLERIEETRTDR